MLHRSRLLAVCVASACLVAGAASPAAAQSASAVAPGDEPPVSRRMDQPEGPLEARAIPMGSASPILRRRSGKMPAYPESIGTSDAAGVMSMRIVIDAQGYVRETRRLILLDFTNAVYGRAPLLGAAFTQAADSALRKWRYDTPDVAPVALVVQLSFEPRRRSHIVRESWQAPEPAPRPAEGSAVPGGAVFFGRGVTSLKKLRDVRPEYPKKALSSGAHGVVAAELVIDPDGRVANVRAIGSHPDFERAVLDAIRQWQFAPLRSEGVAAPLIAAVNVHFEMER